MGLLFWGSGTPTFWLGLLLFTKRESRTPTFKILVRTLPSCPPRMRKDWKRKAILEEFDPLPQKALRTIQDYQQEILEVFEQKKRHEQVFFRTPWFIGKFLRGWQMDVPQGHSHGIDPRAFLKEVRPQIKKKLIKELLDLGGITFKLALKVQLQKESPDGTEEFTDPVLHHKQEALLQASKIKEALDKAIPHLLGLLEKWTQRVGVGGRQSADSLAGHH